MHRWLKKANPELKQFPSPTPGLPDPNEMRTPEEAERCATVNQTITSMALNPPKKRKRGQYLTHLDDARLAIAKYANIHGATKAARKFSTADKKISESTVRGWVTKFRKEMKTTEKDVDEVTADDLKNKPRGRPLMLGDELDKQVQEHIKAIRESGGVINRTIVLATGHGIVSSHNRSFLEEYGGHIKLDRGWSTSLMERMGYVYRKGTHATSSIPANFDELQQDFYKRIRKTVKKYKIPDQLIINFDQTAVKIVPVSDWTLEEKGSEQVDITGIDDKRGITALLGEAASGDLIPPQLIYQGKTDACHPSFKFPEEFNVTHSESHWSTTETMLEYVDKVLVPYKERIIDEMDLPLRQKALVIFDVYKAHQSEEFLQKLKKKGFKIAFVPGGCTSKLQPLDVSGNKSFKDGLKMNFTFWYSNTVADQMKQGKTAKEVNIDLKLSYLKPKHARWVLSAFDKLKNNTDVLKAGWEKTGITAAIAAARC